MSSKQVKDNRPGNKARAMRQKRKSGIFKFMDDLETIGADFCGAESQSKLYAALVATGVMGTAYGCYRAGRKVSETLDRAMDAAGGVAEETKKAAEDVRENVERIVKDGVTVNHKLSFDSIVQSIIEKLAPDAKDQNAIKALTKVVAIVVLIYAAYSRSPLAMVGATALAAYVYRDSCTELLSAIFSVERQSGGDAE